MQHSYIMYNIHKETAYFTAKHSNSVNPLTPTVTIWVQL